MKHARADYDHIQDPSGKIPADEPVFLLRACDVFAPDIIRAWADKLAWVTFEDAELVVLAKTQADKMEEWQSIHGSKVPDL